MNFDLDFYKGKKVFVTGHTGFKGSWLCKMLVNAGAIVTGYSLNPPTSPSLYEIAGIEQDVHSVIGDIRDFKTLKAAFDEAQPEIVLHLAAQPIVRDSYKNPAYTYETNVMGTVNILECVRNSSCVKSFLNVTTDKVYLNKEWAWGYRENEELDGYDPYSNSKSCSELVTHSYKNSFFNDDHVAISTARAGNVIGGGDFANDRMHIMRIGCFIGCGSMHEAESLVEMNEDKVISNLGYMYKATKTAAHWIGKAKCGTYGIRFFWPLINTYGEEERSARLVNTIIRKVLHGESPDLSAGNQYYDFVHVSDVARALILIAEKGVDGTNYTIGSGDAKPLKEFLKIVGQVANDLHDGEPVELGFGKITSNVISLPITTFDVTKLYKDTGFKPLIPFRKGIERTARWIKEDEGM